VRQKTITIKPETPTEPGQTQLANSQGQKILKSIEFSKWFRESDANHCRHSIQKADS
jgi:hypothetical protein